MSRQDDLTSNANPLSPTFGNSLSLDEARRAGEERRMRFPGENLTKPTHVGIPEWNAYNGNN